MKILITNVFGDYNKGDRALFEELVACINREISGAEIHAIARFPENMSSLPDNVVLHKQFTRINGRNIFKRVIAYSYIHFSMLMALVFPAFAFLVPGWRGAVLKHYRTADLVISCPGGFIEDSNASYFVNLFQIFLAIVSKRRVVIAPQSIGPVKSKVGRWFIKSILLKAEKIFVRERESYRFLVELNIPEELIKLTTDLAFTKHVEFQLKNEPSDSLHYSTVVNWNFPESNSVSKSRDNYIYAMASYYEWLYVTHGIRTSIINQVSSDLPIAYEIQRVANKSGEFIVAVDEESYLPDEIIRKISNTKFFTGTRFHSCIFSLLALTPCIPIAYLPKTTGMIAELPLGISALNIYDISSSELIERAKYCMKNYASMRQEITLALAVAKSADEFSSYLREPS